MKLIVLLLICSFLSSGNLSAGKIRAALYSTDAENIDPQLIWAIRDRAKQIYGIKVVFKGKLKYPTKTRNGYKANDFADRLNKKRGKQEYAIGLTDQDIYVLKFDEENWSFYVDTVLGHADFLLHSCIISSARLEDKNTFTRTINVVMHELGHLVGLEHCEDLDCLMIAYDQLDNYALCAKCRRKLEKLKR